MDSNLVKDLAIVIMTNSNSHLMKVTKMLINFHLMKVTNLVIKRH